MSEQRQFEICSHHLLYYCTRSSLSCLPFFLTIPIFTIFVIGRIFKCTFLLHTSHSLYVRFGNPHSLCFSCLIEIAG